MSGSKFNDKLLCRIAIGNPGRNLGKVVNKEQAWSTLRKRLGTPVVSPLTHKQYSALSVSEKNEQKNIGGFWLGGHCDEGVRANKNIKFRHVIALDLDNTSTEMLDDITMGLTGVSKFEFFMHSTRSHTEENPRLRLVFPLRNRIEAEKFTAASRILAQKLDSTMDQIDDVSFRLAQMMYFPSHGKNQEFITFHNQGEALDVDAMLADWSETPDAWKNYDRLPFSEAQGKKRQSAEKAEDPREKSGIVGAFCRAFSIEDAITEFLPDVYEPVDEETNKPRYTFTGGHGYSGAVVEDDGLFLYSHHGTDPVSERLVNAFDLVRIHLFGDLAEEEDERTGMTKRKSFLKMAALASKNPTIQAQSVADDLSDLDDDDVHDGVDTIEEVLESEEDEEPVAATAEDEDPEIAALLGGPAVAMPAGPWKKVKPAKLPKPTNPIEELNRSHALVNMGGKARILNIPQPGDYSTEENFSLSSDFCTFYRKRKIPDGTRQVPLGEYWLDHVDHREYLKGLIFAPNYRERKGYYNLWQGFNVIPDPRPSCDLFLEHLRLNVCTGNAGHYDYLMRYLAHMIQRPQEKPGVALVLRGKKGVGKDTLGDMVGLLFPRNHVKIVSMNQLVGNFNAHLERALLLQAEEAIWAGDKKGHGPLQTLITSPTLSIERKGVDVEHNRPSYVRLLMTSNEDWVVPATEGERRYFVLDVGDARAKDIVFFSRLRRQMEVEGGLEKLLYLLQNWDLTGFQVRSVPDTAGLANQQLVGLRNIDAWWYDVLEGGQITHDEIDELDEGTTDHDDRTWHTKSIRVGKQALHTLYDMWRKDRPHMGNNMVLSPTAFGRELRRLCPSVPCRDVRSPGSRERMFLLPALPIARAEFVKVTKIEAVWPDDDETLL